MTSPLITELRQLLDSEVYLKELSIHMDNGTILVETVKGSLYEKTVQQVRDNIKVPKTHPMELDYLDYIPVSIVTPASSEGEHVCSTCGTTSTETFCLECGGAIPC